MTFTQTVLLASSTASIYRASIVQSLNQLKSAFYNPQYFPKFLGGFMICSGIAGYQTMGYIQKQRQEVNIITEKVPNMCHRFLLNRHLLVYFVK